MSKQSSRRDFFKKTATFAGALAGARLLGVQAVFADGLPSEKIRMVVIGCGGRGREAHIVPCMGEKLVAIVEPDPKNVAQVFNPKKDKNGKVEHQLDAGQVKVFTDYRKLFDEYHKEFDAVSVATTNQHHATPALMGMKLGKHAYVEKPLCYTIAEARLMAEYSKKYKVATQMGNQGHSGAAYRTLCEYIWAGAIGQVHTVYCWTDRSNGGVGPRPPTETPPAGMDWDSWIGPAPYRDYHKDLHPHEWHGWHDFGNGSLGNMACHVMDGAHWSLKLGAPTSIVVEEAGGGTEERYTTGTRIRWDFPARGEMGPVKLYWYDGKKKGLKTAEKGEYDDSVDPKAQNLPPLFHELAKKYDRKFEGSGTLYVGDKGIMFTGCYGGGVRIIPEEQHKATPVPAQTIPRIKGTHYGDFLRGIRGGEPPCSNFEVASKLTELLLLGCLAIKAGVGKKLEWDGDKVTNLPEINKLLSREPRKGWGI
ncbi:MAG TPA: Gfo/Idh/MocA family oxidoreductase [Planctomycetota bacterium]